MMHEMANYSEDVGDKDKAKRLRQQKKEERKNRVYTSLKFIRGKMIDGCGITRLLVPASWPTSTTYDETIKTLNNRQTAFLSYQHFQSHGTRRTYA